MSQSDNLLERAQAALDLGRQQEAASFASQAVASSPDDPQGHVMLAWALLTVDDKEALASAERAIALDPDGPSGFDAACVAAGNAREKQKALDYAKRYVELRPLSARSQRRYAGTLHDYGKHKQRHEALAAAEEAVRLDPHNATNFNELGRIQRDAFDEKDAAHAAFMQALEVDPNNGWAKRQLAYKVEDEGDKATALSLVQSVIRLDPTDKWAREQLDDIIVRFMSDLLWAALVAGIAIWIGLVFIIDAMRGGG